jgi:hypothetical protein
MSRYERFLAIALLAAGIVQMTLAASLEVEAPLDPKTGQVARASSEAASTSRFDIVTLSSNAYERCRISKVEPSAITFFHSKGIVRIPFSDLPEEWQKKYNYDPEKAKAYEKAAAEQRLRQHLADVEKAKQQAAADRAYVPEPTSSKPKRAESAEEAVQQSKKAAKQALNPDTVIVPTVSF